ncbi:MAG: metallophosphoesterase [Leptolyngbyaceae cyanobacterium T60_A2020_046]|nr:metallophosphoesterase [Leptolyngbyaceae cyanobacterium T60_A2020_046]
MGSSFSDHSRASLSPQLRPWRSGALRVDRVSVPIADLPDPLVGTTIVQLSDFHFDGLRLSKALLEAAIAESNAIQPDLVCLTGDFVTDDPSPIEELGPQLGRLRSRYGTYAVLGNHDIVTRSGRLHIIDALYRADIAVLWNEVAYPLGGGLPLVGLADLWSGECQPAPLLSALSPTTPRLVLAHNPDTADRLLPWRSDLQLSGHTHGGQVVLPGLGSVPQIMRRVRPYLPRRLTERIPYMSETCDRVVKHWEWALGLHHLRDRYLYVNRGLGTYFPGRLFCPPELTVITLVAATPAEAAPRLGNGDRFRSPG